MGIPANISTPRTYAVQTLNFHQVKCASILPSSLFNHPMLNFQRLADIKQQAVMISGNQLPAGAYLQGAFILADMV